MKDQTIVIEGCLPAEAAGWGVSSLLYFPFEVPEGVTRISVRRGLTPHPRQTIAVLLFDPRGGAGEAPDFAGFRGYQGQVNTDTEFTLTGEAATSTPWYQFGPLPAGRWHLGQWYLHPTEGGLRYRYTVTLGFDGPAPPATLPEPPACSPGAVRTGPGWFCGSLHNHTIYSYDSHIGGAACTPSELVARHKAAGYDFLAVTDHNQARSHWDFASVAAEHPDVLLLRGNEITTLNGHANTLGIPPGRRYEFRMDPGDGRMAEVVKQVHADGALFVVNHPFQACADCTWRYPEAEWEGADAMEVWNRPWAETNRKAVELWDGLLKAGRRIPALGGSDYHRGDAPLAPATWVHAEELSPESVLAAIRRGNTFVSEGPHGPKVFLTSGNALPGNTVAASGTLPVEVRVENAAGCTLRLVWKDGEETRPIRSNAETLAITVPATGPGYVRAEVLHADGAMAALTSAIYRE